MAFDAGRKRVVLFGGETSAGRANDTWDWDGADWTQVADTGPSARRLTGLVSDTAGGRLVLFGGEDGTPALQADTWEWDGSAWTQVDDTGPAARNGHAMAFDSGRSRVVLFGGATAAGPVRDTWERDGAAWTQVQDAGPPSSAQAAMVFDGAESLLFGGFGPTGVPPEVRGSTWVWSGTDWTQVQDIGSPRWGHAMVFDSPRGHPVLFGGIPVPPSDPNVDTSVLGDTWEATVEGAGGGGGQGGAPNILSVTLSPNPASAGTTVTVSVTLDRAAAAPQVVQYDIFDIGITRSVSVPTGSSTGTDTFTVPLFVTPGTHMLQATLGLSFVTAQLTVM
jgi:hypothetical protein